LQPPAALQVPGLLSTFTLTGGERAAEDPFGAPRDDHRSGPVPPSLSIHRLHTLLDGMRRLCVGVAGDFCLDAYWQLDTAPSELSAETGKPTFSVTGQRYAPGGAANVADNLLALGVASVRAFGVTGDDLFGRELRQQLTVRGISTKWLLDVDGWHTPVFAKPHLGAEEQSRFDFGRRNNLTGHWQQAYLDLLRRGIGGLDVLLVNQQLARGVWSEELIHALNAQASLHPATVFVVDGKHLLKHFRGMVAKVASEDTRYLPGVPRGTEGDPDSWEECVRALHAQAGRAVFLTMGREGMLAFDGVGMHHIPAPIARGPVDSVGAGDTAVASLACALAAGGTALEAATIASLAASVSIHKLLQTGTATPGEILKAAALQSADD
jgi:rfaE bifunctional protein kinase chain/domain